MTAHDLQAPGRLDQASTPTDAGTVRASWHGFVPVEGAVIEARADDPITTDRVLKRLEVLRQKLSVRWCGLPGAFAGYDVLEIRGNDALVHGSINLSVRMLSMDKSSHVVELEASHSTERAGRPVTTELLVQGRGRTLEVPQERSFRLAAPGEPSGNFSPRSPRATSQHA